MNEIHPEGAFGANFKGQLFDLMVPEAAKAKHAHQKSQPLEVTQAADLAGWARGKLMAIERGRGSIGVLSGAADPAKAGRIKKPSQL